MANIDILEGDGVTTKTLKSTQTNGIDVPHHNVDNCALPTGASTEATLGTLSGKLPAALGQAAKSLSMSVALASDQDAIPAKNGKTILRAVIDLASATAGDNTIVAADATRKIKVVALEVYLGGGSVLKWKSASTVIVGANTLPANGRVSLPPPAFNDVFHFMTAVNEALVMNSSNAVVIGGVLSYVIEA